MKGLLELMEEHLRQGLKGVDINYSVCASLAGSEKVDADCVKNFQNHLLTGWD